MDQKLHQIDKAEQADLTAAMEVKQIVQAAIVSGEIEPDLRGEMLAALKSVLATFKAIGEIKHWSADGGELSTDAVAAEITELIRRAEG